MKWDYEYIVSSRSRRRSDVRNVVCAPFSGSFHSNNNVAFSSSSSFSPSLSLYLRSSATAVLVGSSCMYNVDRKKGFFFIPSSLISSVSLQSLHPSINLVTRRVEEKQFGLEIDPRATCPCYVFVLILICSLVLWSKSTCVHLSLLFWCALICDPPTNNCVVDLDPERSSSGWIDPLDKALGNMKFIVESNYYYFYNNYL